jgi:hypothetical protein
MELQTDVAVNPRLRYRISAVYVLKSMNPENVFIRDFLHEEMDFEGTNCYMLWEHN